MDQLRRNASRGRLNVTRPYRPEFWTLFGGSPDCESGSIAARCDRRSQSLGGFHPALTRTPFGSIGVAQQACCREEEPAPAPHPQTGLLATLRGDASIASRGDKISRYDGSASPRRRRRVARSSRRDWRGRTDKSQPMGEDVHIVEATLVRPLPWSCLVWAEQERTSRFGDCQRSNDADVAAVGIAMGGRSQTSP